MSPPRDNRGLLLSECQASGLLIEVKCEFCRRPSRLYHPGDMRIIVGNREVDSLRRRLRCEDCGRRDWIEVKGVWLEAVQKQDAFVRRLVRLHIVRRPEWREEKL